MKQMDGTADTPPELVQLYDDFAAISTSPPLWTQRDDLMPMRPRPRPSRTSGDGSSSSTSRSGAASSFRWAAGESAARSAWQTRVCRAPRTPPPTLWCAIQYLGGHETAPEHRHAQNAFRFVIEGEGVWTVVNGDPVAMRRGDLLLTPGWHFHGHHNDTDQPMAWIDGLDVPLSHYTDVGFFEFGSERVTDEASPPVSRNERLWAHPGLRPLSELEQRVSSPPLMAYRWEHTDRALAEQLALEDEGQPATVEQGHAAIRYVNPTTGGDVMPTAG